MLGACRASNEKVSDKVLNVLASVVDRCCPGFSVVRRIHTLSFAEQLLMEST